MATLTELMTSAMVNFIKQVAKVPPTTMSKPGMLRKMETLPPVTIARQIRIVPPTRPIIVAISMLAVPEY
jgi:hypothetical protein